MDQHNPAEKRDIEREEPVTSMTKEAAESAAEETEPSALPLQLYGEVPNSIVDGVGLRYAVFVQGCSHHCPGCHNTDSWAPEGGFASNTDEVFIHIAKSKLDRGVTLSGGEPFEQARACAQLAKRIKEELGKNIWTYSGYTYEELCDKEDAALLLRYTDVLIDGPFMKDRRSLDLKWKGSSNQRVIDMQKTRETGQVVLWKNPAELPLDELFVRPPSW